MAFWPWSHHGTIVWNEAASSLDAHCTYHAECRLNRTTRPGPRAYGQQGRPVGMLLAWLEKGATCATKADHEAMKKDLMALIHPDRQRLRAAAEAIAFPPLELERPRLPGEDPEPLGLC